MNECPQCSSTRIRHSRSRNSRERLLKLFNHRAYRCIHCGWRGIVKEKSSKTRKLSVYSPTQIAVIILITIFTLIAVLYWISREEPKPEIPTTVGALFHYRA